MEPISRLQTGIEFQQDENDSNILVIFVNLSVSPAFTWIQAQPSLKRNHHEKTDSINSNTIN